MAWVREKQLTMTCSGRAFQDDAKIIMAWRIEILGRRWFLSNAVIHIRERYWGLRLLITPSSIGWSTDIVLVGRNTSFTLVRFETSGWAGQLSNSSAMFLALSRNIQSCFQTHSSNSSLVIQLLISILARYPSYKDRKLFS